MNARRTAVVMASMFAAAASAARAGEAEKEPMSGRIEVVGREHSFTVRFYLRNHTAKGVAVLCGHGGSGISEVPMLTLRYGHSIGVWIKPPVYHHPPRRTMEPNVTPVPANAEALYGEFTMGWPPGFGGRYREGTLSARFTARCCDAPLPPRGTPFQWREHRIEAPEVAVAMPPAPKQRETEDR